MNSPVEFFDDLYESVDETVKEQCLHTYTDMCKNVPARLFKEVKPTLLAACAVGEDVGHASSQDIAFQQFDASPDLYMLSSNTKNLIYIDVPRTFREFTEKSGAVAAFLKDDRRFSSMLLILCRVLCAVCKLLSAEYSQGMNYAAGGVILNFFMKAYHASSSSLKTEQRSPLAGITSCFTSFGAVEGASFISFDKEVMACVSVYHLFSSEDLLPLLKGSGQLFVQEKRLEYVLSRCGATTRVVGHLEDLGSSLDFLTQQWLETCFTVGIPYDISILIQEILLSRTEREIFLRMGLAIFAILQARILQLKDAGSIVNEIRRMVRQLTPGEVLYYFSHFRVNVNAAGIMEIIQPKDTSQLPIVLADHSISELDIKEIRDKYKFHTTAEWVRRNIDPELRDHVGSLYTAFITAHLPPVNLFSVGHSKQPEPSVSTGGNEFLEHALLSDLSARCKRGIYIDTPRTLAEFEPKSKHISSFLKVRSNEDKTLLALCRMLCVACKLNQMGYCQGMNFLAASVLLNCVCETEPVETGNALEIKACQLFCHLLTCQNIIDWFKESQALSEQLKRLDFILMRHVPSSLATQYLDKCGFATQVWAMEWFTTCCIVGASRELGILVQNMLLSGVEPDVIFKVGAAMISLCQDKILQLKNTDTILQDLRQLLRSLDCDEVLRLALRYRINSGIIDMAPSLVDFSVSSWGLATSSSSTTDYYATENGAEKCIIC